jgi:predicted DNA-binding WGR domain protein
MAYLTRTDPTRNINRFYLVDVTPTLSGEWAVLREWGAAQLARHRAAEQLPAPQ